MVNTYVKHLLRNRSEEFHSNIFTPKLSLPKAKCGMAHTPEHAVIIIIDWTIRQYWNFARKKIANWDSVFIFLASLSNI